MIKRPKNLIVIIILLLMVTTRNSVQTQFSLASKRYLQDYKKAIGSYKAAQF